MDSLEFAANMLRFFLDKLLRGCVHRDGQVSILFTVATDERGTRKHLNNNDRINKLINCKASAIHLK